MIVLQMTSVEHVLEYENLPQEHPDSDFELPPDWPGDASIEFKNVSLVYPGSANHALQKINFSVRNGEKVRNFPRSFNQFNSF